MISIEDLYKLYCACSYRVTTDSRAISGGEIFFALKGENFDGNAYAVPALDKGAAWAVVDASYDFGAAAGKPGLIRVQDPFAALQALAVYHRGKLDIPVIGLTGTNGKTTTKELIATVLRTRFEVCATEGNLNNDIGVPLSLLKMKPDTQIAVIEMGASHLDDIDKLVKLSQPTHGLITNVGKAHLQGFGSLEGVKAAKGELYKWLGSHDGSVIFLNQDDPDLVEMASHECCHVFGYGLKYQGVELLPGSAGEPFVGLRFQDGANVKTHLVGQYNASNVLAALAIGEYFGVSRAGALAAIGGYVPSNKRSQLQRSGSNTLIIDAYNANPSSIGVALSGLFAMKGDSKVAMLGDMRELGDESLSEHMAIVERLKASDVKYYLVGEEFRKALVACGVPGVDFSPVRHSALNAQAPGCEPGAVVPVNATIPADSLFRGWFPDSPSLSLDLGLHPVSDSIILIKGSRGIQMERILAALDR